MEAVQNKVGDTVGQAANQKQKPVNWRQKNRESETNDELETKPRNQNHDL